MDKPPSKKLAVTYRPIEALTPHARNSRTHSAAQIDQIAASIKEFGFTNPVLLDGAAGIIAGHGRIAAARQLGMSEVPCIDLHGMTDAQKRAYVIADNKLALNAGWDNDILRLEIEDLKLADFDLGLLGFSDDELAGLLIEQTAGLTDPDDAPEVTDKPVTELGEVWLLGRHRIVCGDCTEVGIVDKALNGVKPHLMVTDPPYGVEYDASWRDKVIGKTGVTGTAKGKVLNDNKPDWRDAWSLFTGEVAYVWHAGVFSPVVADSLFSCDFEARALIVWAKSSLVMSRGHYHHMHEPCWYVVRKGANGHWSGDRKQTTLWQIDKPRKSETGHSTQKPIECMKRPIENNSNPGQAVYEPFSGSGTTIIAAEMTGRVCHAIELSSNYVDVAVKRWQNFTGKQATLEGDGRTFDEIAAERITSVEA